MDREVQESLLFHLHYLMMHCHLDISSHAWVSSHTLQTTCQLSMPWWRRSCNNFSLPQFELPHLPCSVFMVHAPLWDQRIQVFLLLFGDFSYVAFTHATCIKNTCYDTKLDPDILTSRMHTELHIKEHINQVT